MLMWIMLSLGWAIAGLFLGLWLGERGRRTDLGWLAGLAVPSSKPAGPEPEVSRVATAEEELLQVVELNELVDSIFDERKASGSPISRSEAEAEARRLLQEIELISGPGGGP